MKKNFAQSLALIFTMLIGAAFTTQVSAQTTVDELIFGNTNKTIFDISTLPPGSTTVVINEVYGGGGNTGATYNQDYVELYNLTNADINLANFTLQYASATGATPTSFALCTITTANSPGGTLIPANGFYLIATGPVSTTVGAALTGVNTTCPTAMNLAGTAGKIALSSTTTLLNATSCPPTNGTIVDFVGYGSTASCSETAPAPAPANNVNSIQRIPNGTDTDNNSADFRAATNTPKAANSAAGNTAPTISDITDKTTPVNTSTGAINFTIGDAETAAASLTVTATSSNQTLVPNANIVLGGTTTARTITITPAANQTGTTTITVTVSDGTTTTSDTFVLTVTPANTAPTITSANNATFTEGAAGTFTITTTGTPTPTVTESGALPAGVTFIDNGDGTATISGTPAAGTAGTYTLTLTATNSAGSVNQTFTLTVNPAPTNIDLTLSLSNSPNPAQIGNAETYTLTVKNTRTTTATGVEVDFKLPTGTAAYTYTSATDAGGNNFTAALDTSTTPNTVRFTGGTISGGATPFTNAPDAVPGNTATLQVVITPKSSGTLTSNTGDAVVDPFNTIVETNEGNNQTTATTNVPVGNAPAASTVTVNPSNMNGFAFVTEGANGSGGFVTGPGMPPIGSGSAFLTVDQNGREDLLTQQYAGTRLADITSLSYSAYRDNSNTTNQNLTISLQFDVDFNLSDATTTYMGRLVYEPAANNIAVTPNTFQTFDALAGGFYATNQAASGGNCTQASLCTKAQLLALFPNVGIRFLGAGNPNNGPLILRLGGPISPAGLTAYADALMVGINGVTTTFNFDPNAPTAATVTVGGRAVSSSGRALARTRITLTDSAGVVRTATTNLSGYYRFADVEVGQTLILTARSKGYVFQQPTQIVSLNEETMNINFTAYPNGDAGR